MESNVENVEEIANSFETTMKKGFLSGLILLVLENEPCHGYKILKEIEERTLGFFHPTSSTLYPLLDSLSQKKLIEYIEEKVEDSRHKKIYKITPKGEKTLKMLLQKHQKMIDSIKAIIFSTLGITDEKEPIFLEYLDRIISTPEMDLIKAKSTDEKIKILKSYKGRLLQQLNILNQNLKTINDLLFNLENETNKNLEKELINS